MASSAQTSRTLTAPLPGVVGTSPAMQAVYRLARLAASSRATVLIVGETGTGKELIARAIHECSPRADGPYVRVNCGALTDNLLESELFGHVRGAFTGAIEDRTGRFEAAHTGTIFLDEIATMSPKLQVKLLRFLQEHEFERVGESRTIQVDARVIAATNRYPEEEVAAGNLRDDLYYRLNVVPIYLPPLRERKEDIPALAEYFIARYAEENGKTVRGLEPSALDVLLDHDWPGNVRELENDMERAVVLTEEEWLTGDFIAGQIGRKRRLRLPSRRPDIAALLQQLAELARHSFAHNGESKMYERLVGGLERELIRQVLDECDHVQIRAAARLGINRNTLHKKMIQFGLVDERPVESTSPRSGW